MCRSRRCCATTTRVKPPSCRPVRNVRQHPRRKMREVIAIRQRSREGQTRDRGTIAGRTSRCAARACPARWLRPDRRLAAPAGPPGRCCRRPPPCCIPGPEDGPLRPLRRPAGRGARPWRHQRHHAEQTMLGGPDGVTAANRFATAARPMAVPCWSARPQRPWPGWWVTRAPGSRGRLAAGLRRPGTRRGGGREALPPPASAPSAAASWRRTGRRRGAARLRPDRLAGVAGARPAGRRRRGGAGPGGCRGRGAAGTDVPARLAAIGARPWFTLEAGRRRDPRCPRRRRCRIAAGGDAALRAGFLAAAASARLRRRAAAAGADPGQSGRAWRSAAQRWLDEEPRIGLAAGSASPPGRSRRRCCSALAPPPAAALAYREWLLRRLNWRPD